MDEFPTKPVALFLSVMSIVIKALNAGRLYQIFLHNFSDFRDVFHLALTNDLIFSEKLDLGAQASNYFVWVLILAVCITCTCIFCPRYPPRHTYSHISCPAECMVQLAQGEQNISSGRQVCRAGCLQFPGHTHLPRITEATASGWLPHSTTNPGCAK